jgi:hypothetical protein
MINDRAPKTTIEDAHQDLDSFKMIMQSAFDIHILPRACFPYSYNLTTRI